MAKKRELVRQKERPKCALCSKPMHAQSSTMNVTYYKCENEDCLSKHLVPKPRLTKQERDEVYGRQSGGRMKERGVPTGPLDEGELKGPLNSDSSDGE